MPEENEILRQIHEMKEKSVDGFIIHPRLGFPKSIGYLTDDFFDLSELLLKKLNVCKCVSF